MAVLQNAATFYTRIMKNLSFRSSGNALQPEAYEYKPGNQALCFVSVPRLLFAAKTRQGQWSFCFCSRLRYSIPVTTCVFMPSITGYCSSIRRWFGAGLGTARLSSE
jgi:hypothetical protein